MRWVNFLHIYQPPSQTPEILRRATEESYKKIVEQLDLVPEGKLTINISGALTELLHHHGYDDVLADYRRLLERGQIELTESACYHPFLPALPRAEIIRQIELNHKINREYFGPSYQPKGFYAPEMVYTPELGNIIRELGYRWALIDEASYPGMLPDAEVVYQSEDVPGLDLFFRNRNFSFEILSAQIDKVEDFKKSLGERINKEVYVLTGMDGETFGHHRYGLEKLLGALLQALPTATISELYEFFPLRKSITAVQGTWALLSLDEARREPFSRWWNLKNDIHKLQWELTDLAIKVGSSQGEGESRNTLDQALHSDQYWWASAKPWWNIDMIGQGATELLDAVLTAPDASEENKSRAAKLFQEILRTAFHWRASGYVDKLVTEFIDEEARFRIESGLTGQPVKKIQALIADLQRQLDVAVAATEYNRASDFKRRIGELQAELKNIAGKKADNEEEQGDWGT